jgi:predicted ATP-grasp superfamily ATP-dependent carboligase
MYKRALKETDLELFTGLRKGLGFFNQFRRRLEGMPRISVLIPDGEEDFALPLLQCLGYLSQINTHVLARSKMAIARFSRYSAGSHHHLSQNEDQWLGSVRSLVRRFRIDVILPISVKGMRFIDRNRAVIQNTASIPPVPRSELIDLVHDKWSFYQWAMRNEFPVPHTMLVGYSGGGVLAPERIETFDYPALLKPTSLSSGLGTKKVNDPDEFCSVWKNRTGLIDNTPYILQEFVPGLLMNLGVFCERGKIIAWTLWKSLLHARNAFRPALAMEYVDDERLIRVGKRIVSALRWDGIANIDFQFGARDQTAKILDFNPRFGISLVGSLMAGVNFPLISCMSAMNLPYPDMCQKHGVKYAHPKAFPRVWWSQMVERRHGVVNFRESGSLKFALMDPLPLIAKAFSKTIRLVRGRVT